MFSACFLVGWRAGVCYFLPLRALRAATVTFPSPANPRGKCLEAEPTPTEVNAEMPVDFSGSWIGLQKRNWMSPMVGSQPRCCPCALFIFWGVGFVGCQKGWEEFKLGWISLVCKRCEQLFCVWVCIRVCMEDSYLCVCPNMYVQIIQISMYKYVCTNMQPLLCCAFFCLQNLKESNVWFLKVWKKTIWLNICTIVFLYAYM